VIRFAVRSIPCLALLALAGCTNSDLYGSGLAPNEADKISVQGEVCTDDPSAVNFPVKILFVVDGTAGLAMADPHIAADAVNQMIAKYPQKAYSFGIIDYGQLGKDIMGGFTNDPSEVLTGVQTVGIGSGDAQRSYLEAMRTATAMVEDDILGSTPGDRSRTRYVILFTAYGPPTPPLLDIWCLGHNLPPMGPDCNTDFALAFCPTIMPSPADCESLLYPQLVADLRAFALNNGAEDIVFNTFALTPDAKAQSLLAAMAAAGHGDSEVEMPNNINFLLVDAASPSSLLSRRELVVYNANAVIRDGKPVADSDSDGLSDDEEGMIGTDPLSRDTDMDNLGDKVERILGLDPLTPDMPMVCQTVMPPDNDKDQDGLGDCEEALLRTDPSLADTDRDGIPDLVEVLRGGDPLVNDLLFDGNQDGVTDGDAMKQGLDVSTYDPDNQLSFGYQYSVFDEGTKVRLEAEPSDPLPGVVVTAVKGSVEGVGLLRYTPPATLAWSDQAMGTPPGMPVDCSMGGHFTLTASSGQSITVSVTPKDLMMVNGNCPNPMSMNGNCDIEVLVRSTTRSCFHFDVRNITLVTTKEIAGGRPGQGWNTIATYMAEVPISTPQGNSIIDEATFPIRYIAPNKKSPNVAYIDLFQDSFVVLGGP
jgi:hypothetical protein